MRLSLPALLGPSHNSSPQGMTLTRTGTQSLPVLGGLLVRLSTFSLPSEQRRSASHSQTNRTRTRCVLSIAPSYVLPTSFVAAKSKRPRTQHGPATWHYHRGKFSTSKIHHTRWARVKLAHDASAPSLRNRRGGKPVGRRSRPRALWHDASL